MYKEKITAIGPVVTNVSSLRLQRITRLGKEALFVVVFTVIYSRVNYIVDREQ